MGIDKKGFGQLFLIYNIAEIFLKIRWTVLFGESVQFIFHLMLLIQVLLQTIICSLLSCLNFGTENLQGLVHLESHLVPLEVLNVLLDLDLLRATSDAADLDVELRRLIELLADLEVHLLIPLAGSVQGLIVLCESVHQFHQLVQGSHLELSFVDLHEIVRNKSKLTLLVSEKHSPRLLLPSLSTWEETILEI